MTAILNGCVDEALFEPVTCTVKLQVPAVDGVPEIIPAEVIEKPTHDAP
jgi:hypothetical protein